MNHELQQVIARCWSDKEFKARLIEQPRAVLAEHGIDLPADADICIHENTEACFHVVVPERPQELDDQQLGDSSAGAYHFENLT